jgi:Zn-dependent M28 family amino/carboxypeptidase
MQTPIIRLTYIISIGFVSLWLAVSANAQQPPSQPLSDSQYLPAPEILEAAQQITIPAIRAPIRFLSDDLLEGRGPGTTSDDLVQLYLSTQLEGMGLEPASNTLGFKGGWIQQVPMLGVTTRNPATFEFRSGSSSLSLKYFDDMIANAGKPVESVSIANAEVVFVGYGIQAPEYQWDDFKGQDLRGKILLMLNNDPESDPALFAGRKRLYYGRWDYKYASAAKQGAIGAIIIHTDSSAGYPWTVIQTSWSGEEFELEGIDEPRLQVKGWITNEAASKVVSQSGLDLKTLVESAQTREFKPVSLDTKISLELSAAVRSKSTGNVIGMIPGSDPTLKDEYLILMAHHDHLGRSETRDAKGDAIYNGAIDNASGVSALLAITKAIRSLPNPLRRSVLVAAVGAEEQGLLGSAFFAAHPTVDPSRVSAVINMDGINHLGRTADVHLIGAGKNSIDGIVDRVAKFQKRIVTPDLFPEKGSYYRSDQFSLAKIGVPGLYLNAGTRVLGKPSGWGEEQLNAWIKSRYHQTSDDYDPNWNLEGAVEDTQLLFFIACEIANAEQMQTWNQGDEFASLRKEQEK